MMWSQLNRKRTDRTETKLRMAKVARFIRNLFSSYDLCWLAVFQVYINRKSNTFYAHSPASGSSRAFFEKYANILGFPSPAACFLSAIVFFLKHVENRKRKQRVIEAYLPPVLLASVINMADCECQSCRSALIYIEKTLLKIIHSKKWDLISK